MSDLARSIRRHIDTLPTCALSIGEYMNKAAVMAGDEPVFLIRSAPIGTLYSEAIVQLLPLMSSAANALSAPASSEPGTTHSPAEGSMEARVRSAIEGVASMQPELKGRAPLFSKMLFSAVQPYLATAVPTETISAPAPSFSPSNAEVCMIRNNAITEFATWLAESDLLPEVTEEQMEKVMAAWDELGND